MFRVVTSFTPRPMFWLVCDNSSCSSAATSEVSLSDPAAFASAQTAFLQAAAKDGWTLTLQGQSCPGHTRLTAMQLAARAEEEERQKHAGLHLATSVSAADRALANGKGIVTK